MSLTLQAEMLKRQALKEQVCQNYSRLQEQVPRLQKKGWQSRLTPHYQSIPRRVWRMRLQEIGLEVDTKILEITLETQQSFESLGILEKKLQGTLSELAKCRIHFQSILRLYQGSEFEGRGLGFSLASPADFENEFARSGILEKYGPGIANQLRNLIAQRLLEDQPAPTCQEVLRFLEAQVAALPPLKPPSVTAKVQGHPDRSTMLRQAISQAAPLISLNPLHPATNELFLVWLPQGTENPLVAEIVEAAESEKCPVRPSFHHWDEEEIAFIRVLFNIPTPAVESLKRANRVLASLDREEQIAAFRLPVLWFLPRPGEPITHSGLMKLFALGFVGGFFSKRKEHWVFSSKDGTELSLPDLSQESLSKVLSDYRRAVECASWFCHETLSHGFSWARGQLEKLAQQPSLSQGEWPKILLEVNQEICELARFHHQTGGD